MMALQTKEIQSYILMNNWQMQYKQTRMISGGLDQLEISMLKSILVNKDFQNWHPINWQHSCQQPMIRSHVRKSLLTHCGLVTSYDRDLGQHWLR